MLTLRLGILARKRVVILEYARCISEIDRVSAEVLGGFVGVPFKFHGLIVHMIVHTIQVFTFLPTFLEPWTNDLTTMDRSHRATAVSVSKKAVTARGSRVSGLGERVNSNRSSAAQTSAEVQGSMVWMSIIRP
jgi:hypothetical protein